MPDDLKLPSVDEIDFELDEKPENQEKIDSRLKRRIESTEELFLNLKLSLDKLKKEELNFEIKKSDYILIKKKLKDYENKLRLSFNTIEVLKSSLLGISREKEKLDKKTEYYKTQYIDLSNKMQFGEDAFKNLKNKYFFVENEKKELEKKNNELNKKVDELNKTLNLAGLSLDDKERTIRSLKNNLSFVSSKDFKEDKKTEYYRSQYSALLGKTDAEIVDSAGAKQKITVLESQNQKLKEKNLILDGENSSLLSEIEKLKLFYEEQKNKLKEVSKKSIITLNEFETFKEKYSNMQKRNKELLEKDILLDYALAKLKDNYANLKSELTKQRETSRNEINSLKQEYEERIKKIIQENTSVMVNLKTENRLLNERIEELNRIIDDREKQGREFLSMVNTKFGFLSNQEPLSRLKKQDELMSMIRLGFQHGDTLESIESSLINYGYTKKEITDVVKKLKI